MKSNRTKATDIPQSVKKIVWERDKERCVVCQTHYAMPNAHYIRRSKGGLGIPKNIVTLCQDCHHGFDNGKNAIHYQAIIRDYLRGIYPDWNVNDLIYRKGEQ